MASVDEASPGARHGRWLTLRASSGLPLALVAAAHLAALISIYLTEYDLRGRILALLTWALLNCLWLVLLRRPVIAAVLSLSLTEFLIVLSQFKFSVTEMTVSFLDVLIVDADTVAFLLMIFPEVRTAAIVGAIVAVPLLIVIWRIDPFRIRRRSALAAGAACFTAATALATAIPEEPWEPFQGINHVSNFARSGVLSVSHLMSHGWFETDSDVADRLRSTLAETCAPAAKPPHIIMLLDESSFDITAVKDVKVPAGYRAHFRSFDGIERSLLVEATGGPTWYSEYNVLTGLSARSYGRFMFYVTRIAAGRVKRGLPHALRRCGYKTITLYPAYGAFLSARRFQRGAGVERFVDLKDMGVTSDLQPDRFYLDQALQTVAREKASEPLFIFAYVAANHFPWTWTFRPDLTPDWRPLGNTPEIDEYIRRQTMSARDYSDFLKRLRHDFPDEPFLIVRFGDHQPALSIKALDPDAGAATVARRVVAYDPRYFTTYYAIDAVNFTPVDISSALAGIEAPHLPLVVQEAAGLPLDASFAEQKRIFKHCNGLFYRCDGGAQARRFNQLLINAGLIQGL